MPDILAELLGGCRPRLADRRTLAKVAIMAAYEALQNECDRTAAAALAEAQRHLRAIIGVRDEVES